MEFREEQGTFPNGVWERGNGLFGLFGLEGKRGGYLAYLA
jgi:hypothetical protein